MRVLITGGGGFLGSNVVKFLLEKKIQVRAFDLAGQFEQSLPAKDAEIYKGSIMDVNALSNAMRGCDCLIHLAAMLGVERTENKKLDCLEININGTLSMLEACVKNGVKKIIFASSSEVYGEPSKVPIDEAHPLNPRSTYAVTKLAGEEYVKAYSARYGFSYSILRFFNIYGPGQVAEFVIPRYIKSVISGDSPTIYGDGKQIRSFCHVKDTAGGVWLALVKDLPQGEIFNIGNDKEPITMLDLANKIIKISGKKIEPKFVNWKDSDRTASRDIIKRIPDITKARKILGFSPKIKLEEGLKELAASYVEAKWARPANYKT
ncbi:MAG: NAD-dependent epimerase/dehydratase family protein [Candidatus Omnitrophota bacterium]